MTGLSLVVSKRKDLQSQRNQKVIPGETSVYKVLSQRRAACLANGKQFRAGQDTEQLPDTPPQAMPFILQKLGRLEIREFFPHFVNLFGGGLF